MLKSSFNRAGRPFFFGLAAVAGLLVLGHSQTATAQQKKKEIRKIDITRNSQPVSKMVVGSVSKGSDAPAPMTNKEPPPPDVSNFVVGSISRQSNLLNYCLNISDAATEARASMLLRMLKDRETEMTEIITRLEERTAALAEWMEKREKFLARANDSLISIFETMRPDAAAQQLTAMDTGLAAAIVMKLKPKISSVIMAEMKAKNAAQIASLMTSAVGQAPMVKKQ